MADRNPPSIASPTFGEDFYHKFMALGMVYRWFMALGTTEVLVNSVYRDDGLHFVPVTHGQP